MRVGLTNLVQVPSGVSQSPPKTLSFSLTPTATYRSSTNIRDHIVMMTVFSKLKM